MFFLGGFPVRIKMDIQIGVSVKGAMGMALIGNMAESDFGQSLKDDYDFDLTEDGGPVRPVPEVCAGDVWCGIRAEDQKAGE